MPASNVSGTMTKPDMAHHASFLHRELQASVKSCSERCGLKLFSRAGNIHTSKILWIEEYMCICIKACNNK